MYRNNFLFTFSDFGNIPQVGIYKKKGSRELIPCEDINIASPNSKIIVRTFLNWLISNNLAFIRNKNNGYLDHIAIRENDSQQFMIELYINNIEGSRIFVERLKSFNFANMNINTVYVQYFNHRFNFRDEYKLIFGNKYFEYQLLGSKIKIYPGCFFQTNTIIMKEIYKNLIKEFSIGGEIFLDLYCGVGVMSLLVSKFFNKCIGIEINQNSINLAKLNARDNNLDNINFICNPVENNLKNIVSNLCSKVTIFINPPRSGLKENVINEINSIKSKVNKLIYLSCYEKSLKRDLKLFNFESELIGEYNMFPSTSHKELCVKLF